MTHRRFDPRMARGARGTALLLGTLLLAAGPAWSQAAGSNYTFTDLGAAGRAYGINAGGQVVGEVGGGFAAFRWDPDVPNGTSGTLEDLGSLCPDGPCPGAFAHGIDADGRALGSARYDATNLRRAFRTAPWSPIDPPADDLGARTACSQSEAYAANASGQAVGWAQGCASATGCYRDAAAIVWEGTTATCISGRFPSVAYGINASGQVVGSLNSGTTAGAVVWQPAGGGWTPYLLERGGLPHAINDYGQVILNPLEPTVEPRARLWTPAAANGTAGTFTPVTLPGQIASHLYGINSRGQVVGESGGRAFLWTPSAPNGTAGTVVDLNGLLPPGSGWVLTDARAINDAGQIAGAGTRDGAARAFLLTPDFTPPTTTAALSPPANAAGWHRDVVVVTLTADDGPGMGVRDVSYSASGAQPIPPTTVAGDSAQLVIDAEGQTTLTYFASDLAGNVEAPKSRTLRLDLTPPVHTAHASAGGRLYRAGTWTPLDVTVTFHCTDAPSGVAATAPPRTIVTEGADQSAGGTCTDLAGNATDARFDGISIDKTAPGIRCATADGQWHADDASVACRADEVLSGLRDPADASFDLVTRVPEGTETAHAVTLSRTVCDLVGWCAEAGPVGFHKVDKKAPSIDIAVPADGAVYRLGDRVSAAYSCWDGGSSVASCAGTVPEGDLIDTSSPGAKSFTVTATDRVGNLVRRENGYTVAGNSPAPSL